MLKLQEFRSRAKGLPDLLGYSALIAPGTILQKDGSLLATWEIQGQDTASSTPQELAYVSEQFSNAVRRMGTGCMLHIDAIRSTERAYSEPENSHFPDPLCKMLDDKRRKYFSDGVCYTTSVYLTVTYMPEYYASKMAGASQVGVQSMSGLDNGNCAGLS